MSFRLEYFRRILVKKMPLPIKNFLKKQRIVRLSMEYFVDRYWSEALQEVLRHHSAADTGCAMVHPDMLQKVKNSVPYGYSFTLSSADIPVVCVHKGLADELSTKFIEGLLDTHTLVFANAVFCVYSSLKEGKAIKAGKYEEHAFNFHKWLQSRARNREIMRCNNHQNYGKNSISRILIVTANNFGNVGDDAITHAAYELISRVFPNATITLDNLPVKRVDVESTDLLVLGGGGLYYDGDIRNAINYTNLMFFAEEAHVPHIGIGIGTQGIKTDIGKHLFRHALNGASITVVRDPKDKKCLSDLGVTSKIEVTNDIVFTLAPEDLPTYNSTGSTQKTIGIALLDSSNLLAAKHMKSYQQGIFEVVEYLSSCNYKIVYMCQSLDDLPLYKELSKKYGGAIRRISYAESKKGYDFYKDLDLCITSRFHGLIFSAIAGTPVISVGTNGSKTDRLISNKINSLSHAHIPLKELNLNNLKFLINMFEENPDSLSASRVEVSRCRSEALLTGQHISNIFKSVL